MSDDSWLAIYAFAATVNWLFQWRWRVVAEQRLKAYHKVVFDMQTQRDEACREAERFKVQLESVNLVEINGVPVVRGHDVILEFKTSDLPQYAPYLNVTEEDIERLEEDRE